jgi:hypothetical protein
VESFADAKGYTEGMFANFIEEVCSLEIDARIPERESSRPAQVGIDVGDEDSSNHLKVEASPISCGINLLDGKTLEKRSTQKH